MRKARRFVLAALCVLLVGCLCICLCSCLKVGLQKNKVYARLVDNGANVDYVRSTPMTVDGGAGQSIGDILYATLAMDGKEVELYVLYCGNTPSADWVENKCREYKDAKLAGANEDGEEQTVDYSEYVVYRFDETILFGHYKLVALVRGY